MRTATQSDYVTVQDYLAAEAVSDIRHEYLGGLVYAMAGETRDHNHIAQNFLFDLRQHLKGGPCKLYMSDIRVNFNLRKDEYYYYPDIVVTCDKRDNDKRFRFHSCFHICAGDLYTAWAVRWATPRNAVGRVCPQRAASLQASSNGALGTGAPYQRAADRIRFVEHPAISCVRRSKPIGALRRNRSVEGRARQRGRLVVFDEAGGGRGLRVDGVPRTGYA